MPFLAQSPSESATNEPLPKKIWSLHSLGIRDGCTPRDSQHPSRPHAQHSGGIPAANRPIEVGCIAEHRSHVDDVGGVPSTNGLIERISILEHHAHVEHLGSIP